MHLKVFLKLENLKNSLFWAKKTKKKNQKTQKTPKTPKKLKNLLAWFFFFKNRGFSNPA
jgi:hypothetical protein